jgi:hypothetical protein
MYRINLVQLEGESGLPQLIYPLEILVGTRSPMIQEILKGQEVGHCGTMEILIRFGPLPGTNPILPVNTPVKCPHQYRKRELRGSSRPIVE